MRRPSRCSRPSPTAPLLLGLVERRGLRGTIRPFAWLYGLLGAGALLALAGTAVRGSSPLTLLGAYRAAASSTTYTPGGILRFFVYHAAGLDLALGILPFAALLAMWLAPRRPTPAARAFTVASLAVSAWLLAEVAAFASASYVDRIEERNMFYLAPFALIALLGLAADGVVPAPAARSSRQPPSPASCPSSSRIPASSRRARCPTPSRSCRGGGRRIT